LDLELGESELRSLEPLDTPDAGSLREPSVEVVCPTVIGAHESLGLTASAGDLGAIVSADVGESTELSRRIPHEDPRFAAAAACDVAPRFGDLVAMG